MALEVQQIGAVVIGRNEGELLKLSLRVGPGCQASSSLCQFGIGRRKPRACTRPWGSDGGARSVAPLFRRARTQ